MKLIHYQQAASIVAIMFALAATPVQAEESRRTVSTITELGVAPFRGTPEEACHLLKDFGVSYLACIDALAKCTTEEYMFLQDGTVLVTTSTSKNASKGHSAVTAVLALVYPKGHERAGQPLPADHPDRRARMCKQIDANGVTFVIPDACDNPSLALLPPPPTPEVPEEEEEPPPKKVTYIEVCETPGAFSLSTSGIFLPGIGHPDDCGCGLHAPATFVGGETLLTESSPICYTITEGEE